MRAGGMAGAMVSACNDDDLPKTIEIVEAHPGFLFGAWAVHPEYPDHREASEEEIARVASHPQFKAVGETGLDFYWCKEPLDWQRERFRKHIRAARIAKKPLIIHARDAEGAALDILEAEHAGDTGFVMHCFCGTIDEARRAVDLGGHVSFTGNLTFKRNDALREVARSVPLTRLLLETDCPYMAPVPFRGKRAEPLHVEWLARLPLRPSAHSFGRTTLKGLSLLLSLSLLLPLPPASAADVNPASLAAGSPSRADVLKAEAPKMQTALLSDDVSSLKASILVAGTADLILPEGDTPLTLALRAESKRSIDYLLGLEDIDVTKRNRFGESPLMLAVFKANDKAMEAILERGGLPNEHHGWSALHYAATQGNDEYVKKLLSLGADPNVRTNQGVTPLHMAARLPSRSVILTLLRAGAYRNYCTTSGLSPSDFAKKAGDEELAKYLAIERCVKPAK